MPITSGVLIGPYRIESKLGEGGMGTVYRALDTKLNRPVAIKFLSNELADAAARRRFQREAQMASALNHPHILTVHDAGESEGREYLVTEFVDGGTLKDWAQAEKRTWQQVLELLTGVADGLAAAHEAGIMHRDIKPANILVARNGYAKLGDFGLAKLAQDVKPDDATRTLTADPTHPGMIVGTIAYMSPEQAEGRPADARSDIFSFGVVLYEQLSGRRPPAGASGSPQPLSKDIPAPLRAVVEKALEKDPAERYQSMREMVVDLRRAARQASAATGEGNRRLWWVAAGAVIAILAAVVVLYFRSSVAGEPGRDYTQLTNFADSATSPALSADGRLLAFIRGGETFGGPGEIWLKLLPEGEPRQLTHDGVSKMGPVFLPSGARISFTVSRGMFSRSQETWTMPVLGGEPSRLLSNASGLTWIANGAGPPRVLFSELGEGVHMSIVTSTENRSGARAVYTPASTNGMAHRSYASPDGKQVLVVEMEGAWRPCRLVPFEGNDHGKEVGPSPGQCTSAAWSPDGNWMYFSVNIGNGYHIWRQRFPNGTPEQVTVGASEEEGIAFDPDGKSFVTSVGTRQSTLWVHDSRGDRLITSQGYGTLPQLSADGKRLYYLLRSRSNRRFVSGELWTTNLETGQSERLLPNFLVEHYTVSADGNSIVFAAIDEGGHTPVWLATLDGRTAPRHLSSINASRTFFDAKGEVFFLGAEDANGSFIYRVKQDGSGLQKAIPNPVNYLYDVSPDGKSMAVWAGREVLVYSTDGGSPTTVGTVCAAAGGENRGTMPPCVSWSRDGKFFYLFLRTEGQITCAVPLQPGRSLPPLPAAGIASEADAAALPGARIIRQQFTFMGANPSVYAFPKVTAQRNIYRIPVRE